MKKQEEQLQPFNPELKKHRPESKVAIYGRTALSGFLIRVVCSRTNHERFSGRYGAFVKDDATLFTFARLFRSTFFQCFVIRFGASPVILIAYANSAISSPNIYSRTGIPLCRPNLFLLAIEGAAEKKSAVLTIFSGKRERKAHRKTSRFLNARYIRGSLNLFSFRLTAGDSLTEKRLELLWRYV